MGNGAPHDLEVAVVAVEVVSESRPSWVKTIRAKASWRPRLQSGTQVGARDGVLARRWTQAKTPRGESGWAGGGVGVEGDDDNQDECLTPSLKTWSFYTFFSCRCVLYVGSLLRVGYRGRGAKIEVALFSFLKKQGSTIGKRWE